MENLNNNEDVKLFISNQKLTIDEILEEFYQEAVKDMRKEHDEQSNINADIVFNMLETIKPQYKECRNNIERCKTNKLNIWYKSAINEMNKEHDIEAFNNAIVIFEKISKIDPDFKNVKEKIAICNEKIKETERVVQEKKLAEQRKRQEYFRQEEEMRQERARREKEEYLIRKKLLAKERRNKLIKILSIIFISVAVVICVIVAFAHNKKKKDKQKFLNYDASFISVSVLSKSKGESYSHLGITYYTSNFSMEINNGCQIGLSNLECNLKVLDVSNNSSLWSGTVDFSQIPAKENKKFIVELEQRNNILWNYPITGLKIQLKITSALFSDYKTMEYSDTVYKTIYLGDINYKEQTHIQAKNYYNNGQYQQAYDLFICLGSYKDSKTYIDLCEDNLFEIKMKNELYRIAGEDVILPNNYDRIDSYSTGDYLYCNGAYYNCFSASISINDNSILTFVNDFKNQLLAKGFVCVAKLYKRLQKYLV